MQMSLEVDSPAPDDGSLGRQLNCNLMKDLVPDSTAPKIIVALLIVNGVLDLRKHSCFPKL